MNLRSLGALAVLCAAAASTAGAQRGGFRNEGPSGPPKVLIVPGQRAGTSAFPLVNYEQVKPLVAGQMDFKHYHTSVEIEEWMRKWAKEHPDFVELTSVGKSFGGRDIWQLTLTEKKSGKDTDKPAAFFEGGRHSGEITATESALYLAWYLVENYGKDAAVTQLLKTKTVYIKPMNNPDGSDMYRLTAQANRSTVRPYDDDGDGLLDEDPPEDLDGDGFITQLRKYVGPGKGDAVIDTVDKKGRLMRRVGPGKGDYLMMPEGVDNDGDGRVNEDGIGGLDLHRNYPENWRPMREATGRGWTQGGAGEYPLSEPETRAVVLFLMSHANVGVVNSMDTAVPMMLRPPSTCEETECMYPADLKLYQHFDSVGIAKTGYPWAGDVYRTYNTRIAVNPFTGDSARPSPLFGHGPDFGYFQYGSIWYGDELWNGGREKDYNNDGRIEEWEVLRFCDEDYGGKCFKPWTKFTGPGTMGEVEAGGFNPKFWQQNAPPEWLEKWAKNQAMFNLYMAQSLPSVEIVSVTSSLVKPSKPAKGAKVVADSATHEVKVTLRNAGRLPTALDMAKRVKIVRPDMVTVRAESANTRTIGRPEEFWLNGGETKVITIRVKAGAEAADRKLNVRYTSTRGGVVDMGHQIAP
ncbi:MAG: M14 family metallopeptidase [Gemmatimonadota bacterium]|nr:M14 family metallopeptidase [Gemmatimonadota bacterium]